MKKLTALVLAVLLFSVLSAAPAESADMPVFSDTGEAVDAAEENLNCCSRDCYSVVVKAGEKYYRVITDLDETAKEKYAAMNDPEVMDKWAEMQHEFDEYIRTLPVTRIEEITGTPMDSAELEKLSGKTLEELEADGFEWYDYTLHEEAEESAVISIRCGMFRYDVTLGAPPAEFREHEDAGTVGNLTVKSIIPSGLSWHAADPEYPADGSSMPSLNMWDDALDLLTEIITGQFDPS